MLPCQLHLGNVPGYTDWHSRVDPGFGTSVRALRPSLKSLLRAVSNARRHDIKNREEQAELGQYILHRFKHTAPLLEAARIHCEEPETFQDILSLLASVKGFSFLTTLYCS